MEFEGKAYEVAHFVISRGWVLLIVMHASESLSQMTLIVKGAHFEIT